MVCSSFGFASNERHFKFPPPLLFIATNSKIRLSRSVDMSVFTLRRRSAFVLMLLFILVGAAASSAQPADPGRDTNIVLDDLVAAIDRDDKLGVMLVISQGFPPDVTESNGGTLLMQAAKGGKVKVAQYLLDSGADPNIVSTNGATALILAVNGGHAGTVKALLRMKADPNLRGGNIPPALIFAAANENIEMLQALVRSKADVKAVDGRGYNALEYAFLNKKAAALEFLRPIYKSEADRRDLLPARLGEAIVNKDLNSMIRCLALGFDPNRLIGGKSPMAIAKQAGFEKGRELLIYAGAADAGKFTSAVR